ncbi:YbdD/YjiX family protein [Microbacterium lacticum]
MSAVQNSSSSMASGPERAASGRIAHGSKEFCTAARRHFARAAGGIRWYMGQLMGDGAYATYVAHHRRHHPGVAPMSERQFWRERMDDQDRNPGARCC